VAKSFHALPGSEEAGRMRYLAAAEEAYLRAVELDGAYLKPRYGLGVLYVFELDRPEEAVPHLKRCLEITRNDIDAMFVLARAFYMMGNYREAIELYDRIIILTMDERRQLEARENRQTVMEIIYG
jgi:tetratricopeptide (TPR) repeat protein